MELSYSEVSPNTEVGFNIAHFRDEAAGRRPSSGDISVLIYTGYIT